VAKISAGRVKGLARVRDQDNSHKQASVAAAEALIKAETLVVAAGAEAGEAVGTGRTDKCIMWALVRVNLEGYWRAFQQRVDTGGGFPLHRLGIVYT